MSFQRRILLHGPDPEGTPQLLSLSAVKSCWFDLHRQGGCGRGQLVLSDDFDQRDSVQVGDWISFEPENGERWYLGQVQERRANVPAGLQLRLEGMAVELNQVFPGGFGSEADGTRPRLFGATDLFPDDPDQAQQSIDLTSTADELIRLLIGSSLPSTCHIQHDPDLIETPEFPAPVVSLKVRGEESIRALMKDLALRAQGANWGVDEQGTFFFLRPRNEVIATFEERKNLTTLSETQDLEFVFNRILLTGDYVYDRLDQSENVARRSFRWRANFLEPLSRGQFGDRRIRIWLPWIRTRADGVAFAREFFRMYSRPKHRYFIETLAGESLPRPWLGQIQINDHTGAPLIIARPETIRVFFDHIPRFRMELGPADPRELWPEPPQDERWELPNHRQSNGGDVTLPSDDDDGGGGDGGGGGNGGGNGRSSGSETRPPISLSAPSESEHLSSEHSSDSSESSALDSSSAFWLSGSDDSMNWPSFESGQSSLQSSRLSEHSEPGSTEESSGLYDVSSSTGFGSGGTDDGENSHPDMSSRKSVASSSEWLSSNLSLASSSVTSSWAGETSEQDSNDEPGSEASFEESIEAPPSQSGEPEDSEELTDSSEEEMSTSEDDAITYVIDN